MNSSQNASSITPIPCWLQAMADFKTVITTTLDGEGKYTCSYYLFNIFTDMDFKDVFALAPIWYVDKRWMG